jgi:hypothetical protein
MPSETRARRSRKWKANDAAARHGPELKDRGRYPQGNIEQSNELMTISKPEMRRLSAPAGALTAVRERVTSHLSISGIDFSICFFACERRRESKMVTSALAFSRVLQFH